MPFDIKVKKNENEKQTFLQRGENANKSKSCQKSKQVLSKKVLSKKIENQKNSFRNNNKNTITLLSDSVNYIKLVFRKTAKTKKLKRNK